MIAQLDTKSVYTFMESLVTIKDYVQVAKSMGYDALGIMDVDNLYGAYEFIEACQAHKLSPLVGLDVYKRQVSNRLTCSIKRLLNSSPVKLVNPGTSRIFFSG